MNDDRKEDNGWELVERQPGPGGMIHGPKWKTQCAIAIGKAGVTLNGIFTKCYLKDGQSQVLVLYRDSGTIRMLGLKVVPRGEEQPQAFKVRPTGTPKSRNIEPGRTALVGCTGLSQKRLADLRGKAFRAIRNPASGLIEVELSPANEV